MPRLVEQLEDESDCAENKSDQKRADGSLPVQSRPQDAEDEARRNRRADVTLDALQINVKLRAKQMDEWYPEDAENDHRARGESAEKHELPLGRVGLEFLVEVQRHHGRGGVEH